MRVKDILQVIDNFAPFAAQSEHDRSGLQVGDPEADVTGVMVAVDLTPALIEESIAAGCNVIVTHHPAIWLPLATVVATDYTARMVTALIRNGISYIAAHTNVDKCAGGNSERIVALLGGRVTGRLPEDEFAITFEMDEIRLYDLLGRVRSRLDDPTAYAVGANDPVTRGALCTGAGADDDTIAACLSQGLVYLSGEFKHHQLRYVEQNNGHIICFGHFTSEHIFVTIIVEQLQVAGVKVLASCQNNPCHIG